MIMCGLTCVGCVYFRSYDKALWKRYILITKKVYKVQLSYDLFILY